MREISFDRDNVYVFVSPSDVFRLLACSVVRLFGCQPGEGKLAAYLRGNLSMSRGKNVTKL